MKAASGSGGRWFGWQRKAGSPVSIGMVLAFKATASPALADRPGRVVAIWPRFRSGDYLVTLEYAQPLAHRNEVIRQIEAFRSELYQPIGAARAA